MTKAAVGNRENTFVYDPEKLEAAILFFIERANNGHLGKTKLMKLLYYADFDHMERYGEPITGARYRKCDQGPVPCEALDILQNMEVQGKIRVEQHDRGLYVQFRYQSMSKPNLELFSDSEMATLEQVVDRWGHEPLSRIVAATHAEAPWLSVRLREIIPYSLAHYRSSLSLDR